MTTCRIPIKLWIQGSLHIDIERYRIYKFDIYMYIYLVYMCSFLKKKGLYQQLNIHLTQAIKATKISGL
jgi:hypothetical protein